MAATTTTITPTSAPAIAPAGTGDPSEPRVGKRDNAGVEVTGGGVLPGFGSMVGTRSPVLLLTGIVEGRNIQMKLWFLKDTEEASVGREVG